MKLRPVNDEEYEQAKALARQTSIPLSQCPTCLAKETEILDSDGVMEFRNGTYRLHGEEHACDCQTQIALRMRYLLAGLPDQFMRFDWENEYDQADIKSEVEGYLASWENLRFHGMGVEFGGPLGVGKTASATYIGRELIKRGERVLFTRFKEVVGAFEKVNSEAIEDRMRGVPVLIIDEVLAPSSDRMASLYADKLETLIRHRTDFNLPTIITTNLTEEQLTDHYPRIYSLLAPKQRRIEIGGEDARPSKVAERNWELALNNERYPIQ